MPDEALITQIENLLAEIIDLGGDNERSQIVPNLTVQDANPTNLDGWVIISDDRDGDNILARKVGSVIYDDNDLVNVMFLRGTEPIAFQQGSESSNNGIWEIVPSTTTDIFYDKGDVGIGKSVAPDAALEILDTAQQQLRLTFQEDTKFVDFTLDTNHDLTITPSSTGQVIIQPTTDQTNSVQILDADGGLPVFNADLVNERIGIGTAAPDVILDIQKSDSTGADANIPQIRVTNTSLVHSLNFANFQAFAGDGAVKGFFGARYSVGANDDSVFIEADAANPITFKISTDRMRLDTSGRLGIGTNSPSAHLHVDQASTTAAQPVLYLDQADISEEMIEFNTTIGVGNAIEAVGAKALTTTHFIKVTLPGALTRYFPVGTIA